MSEPAAPGADAPPVADPPPVDRVRAIRAALLAWLVPGLGHVSLGWRGRGLLYAVIIHGMLVTGLLLEGTLSTPNSGAYLATLATVADAGNGIGYLVAQATGWGAGRAASATHEAGNAFHWSAGIMNMLLVADAWDIATGRKTRQPG